MERPLVWEASGSEPSLPNGGLTNSPVFSWAALRRKHHTTRRCVGSKAAALILLWALAVGHVTWLLNPVVYLDLYEISTNNFQPLFGRYHPNDTVIVYLYGSCAIIFGFFPLAGFLADVKCGRYRTIGGSSDILLSGTVLLIITRTFELTISHWIVFYIKWFSYLVLIIGLVGFLANIIQFGMDQLHDTPGEDRTLFIHWYVFATNITTAMGLLVHNTPFQFMFPDNDFLYLEISILFLAMLLLMISSCLARHKQRWFLIEPGGRNPYKLVYCVTKFAHQHQTPVHRSAFTYCEDEVPSGLDLGKEKYGGPFTTEQVEDVKAFYGILKVLFSFGLVFFLDFAANSTLPLFARQLNYHSSVIEYVFFHIGLVSPLLTSLCILLYLLAFRPFLSRYFPGMLKRMGIGMIVVILSLIASFSMDIATQFTNGMQNTTTISCMFLSAINTTTYSHLSPPLYSNTYPLAMQLTLSALSNILIYISAFEFICAQSPHFMKGLIIGLFYAIKGFYQLLATLLIVPFILHPDLSPSCNIYYYLINIVVGICAVSLYGWVAKQYKYRVRDEEINVHRYVEEYYSNTIERSRAAEEEDRAAEDR